MTKQGVRSLWQMRYVLFVRAEHVSSISNLQVACYTYAHTRE